jgi:hypothetical protein
MQFAYKIGVGHMPEYVIKTALPSGDDADVDRVADNGKGKAELFKVLGKLFVCHTALVVYDHVPVCTFFKGFKASLGQFHIVRAGSLAHHE